MSDESEVLHTAGGHRVKAAPLTRDRIRNKITVLYGPTQSGKSVIIRYLMLKVLKNSVDQCIVVSENELENQGFRGLVPPSLVHYRIYMCAPDCPDCTSPDVVCKRAPRNDKDAKAGAQRMLEEISARQKAMIAVFKKANDHRILYRLLGRWHRECQITPQEQKSYATVIKAIAEAQRRRDTVRGEIDKAKLSEAQSQKKKEELDENTYELVAALCKKILRIPRVSWALRKLPGVGSEDLYALNNLDINPHMLLVFDDCASTLKPLSSTDMFKRLFYQGRHFKLTTIITCQAATNLNKDLRMNAHNSIFTDQATASAFFNLLGVPKEVKTHVADVLNAVFNDPDHEFRKFFFIREDPTKQYYFYYDKEEVARRQFCSRYVVELAERTRRPAADEDDENPYMRAFAQ